MLTQLEALASHEVPFEGKLVAQNVMRNGLEKILGSEQIGKETKELVDSVIKIDQGFEGVKIELGGIDRGRFRGKPAEQFQPQWVEHHHRFISLIWRSRTVARQTGTYVKEFVNVILPTLEHLSNRTEHKEAAAAVTEFALRKDPFAHNLALDTKDEMHSPDFTELQCGVTAFRHCFELFIEEQGIKLQNDVVLLQEEISDLVWQIKRCKTLIPVLSKTLDVAILLSDKCSISAVSALAPIVPMRSLSIFLSGVIDAVPECVDIVLSISKIIGFRGEIHRYQHQLDRKKAELTAPELIQVILSSQGSAFDDVCGRIDQLSAIWSLVAQDAASIVSDLEHVYQDKDGGCAQKAFVTRVKLVKIAYEVLVGLLGEYARQIERHSFRFGQTSFRHE